MALSSIPSNFVSTSSPSCSLYFIIIRPRTHSLISFRAQKLQISCCQQTVQLDTESQQRTNLVTKKKRRKPRPSFLEQIQDKWSVKTPSLRENFPWQQDGSSDTNQEIQPQRLHSSVESEESTSVSFSVDSDVKTSILSPLVHGNWPIRKHFSSEENEQGVRENDQQVLNRVVEDSKEFPKEVTLDGKSEHHYREFGADPVEFSDRNKRLSDHEESKISATFEDSQETKIVDHSGYASSSMRLPWERDMDEEIRERESLRRSNTELAEKSMPESELKRLRNVALIMVERIKVGPAGVTQALVDAIHEKWKHDEVVKLKFEGPPSKNMRKTHEILESRTGGLVIWRSGSAMVLYRGMTYSFDCIKSYNETIPADSESSEDLPKDSTKSMSVKRLNGVVESSRTQTSSNYLNVLSEEETMDLNEINHLLDELGPRFIDWSGPEPLPVDSDLLPGVVSGYKPPFRLLPYGIRQTLRNQEMTYLRRTARFMPPHFALGRNRELQGLATAMVKLWEKSGIAKIAIKRGVHNINNERMAEELKMLTGGTLLSRNKEYIVFYRGNDFLPPGVTSSLTELEKSTTQKQDEEEQARNRASILFNENGKAQKLPLVAGTLAETVAATSRWGNEPSSEEMEKIMKDTDLAKHASLVKSLQTKLALAKAKIGQAEKALNKLYEDREPADLPIDLETLSDEERFLLRRIGLSMKPYLLLGRREIFDGTIENMHLHWKYRELVKIIVQRKPFAQVKHIAVSLEAESGGVLVSIEKTTKGHVIIVYRGKNYQRPNAFRPKNLLTKRQALARSIELQRREALKHHVWELEEKIEKLKHELENLEAENEKEQTLLSCE